MHAVPTGPPRLVKSTPTLFRCAMREVAAIRLALLRPSLHDELPAITLKTLAFYNFFSSLGSSGAAP
jgi:hypothetical protein